MATSDGYGQRLGERLRVESAPAIVTRALRKAEIAVTEIRCDDPLPGTTGSIHREDAFLVGLQLRDFPHHEYWEDGRQMPVCDLRVGDSLFYDLKRDPVALLDKPHHSLLFYLPRGALNAIADFLTKQPLTVRLATVAQACYPDSHPDNRLFLKLIK
jgi:AraC family transcriptional regulator